MARRPKIRITKNDKREYAKLVKNTRSKISRTLKNHGKDLTDEIPIPKIEDFVDRKSYNKQKRLMKDFLSRSNLKYQFIKNEHGISIDKLRWKKIKEETKIARKQTKAMIKKVEKKDYYAGGEKTGSTVGQITQQMQAPNAGGVYVPDEFNFANIKSVKQLERFERKVEKRADPTYFNQRNKTMQNNFIYVLGLSFNSDADELIEMIRQVPPDDFYEIYMMFDEFRFNLYDSKNQTANTEKEGKQDDVSKDEGNLEIMKGYLEMYLDGKIDFPLKGFNK